MDAQKIVAAMLQEDAFSRWLGLEVLALGPGHCSLKMSIREDMLNGFGIAHGGIAYALADSALAFASNARGRKAVSVETSISHTQQLRVGDVLQATAREEHLGGRIAICCGAPASIERRDLSPTFPLSRPCRVSLRPSRR